ncbi:response regulator [Desulfoluna sp.]|uniref:response regulator n=1 Tax=Desulfoluna sp. TaxID=2045199 RepID=UPI0026299200|nr:response regulator [Desulfoluna sp.]
MVSLLVIDDDQILLDLYRQMLKRQGYRVHTADSGEKGIRMFDNGDYALVITDLVMGGMDGNGVAEYIRRSPKGMVPVIGVSGTPWRAHDRHFDAVMEKPVSMKDLVASVRLLAGWPSKGRGGREGGAGCGTIQT